MNNLKLNFLWSFVTFGIILILASCSPDQTELIEDNTDNPIVDSKALLPQENTEPTEKTSLLLPLSLKDASEEEISEFVLNLTREGMDELVEHTRVAIYLRSINKFDKVVSSLPEILSINNIEHMLTKNEVGALKRFKVITEENSRWCSNWGNTACNWKVIYSATGHCLRKQWVCFKKRWCFGPYQTIWYTYVGNLKYCWEYGQY